MKEKSNNQAYSSSYDLSEVILFFSKCIGKFSLVRIVLARGGCDKVAKVVGSTENYLIVMSDFDD